MPDATGEVRELFERVRSGARGTEDLIAAFALMQGTFDVNSLLAGMLLGRGGGRGLDRSALLLLAVSMSSANTAAAQAGGTATTNPMQQLLPLLLFLGGDESQERTVEVVSRDRDSQRRRA